MHIFFYQEQMEGQYVVYGSLIVFFTSLTVSLIVKMWCCDAEEEYIPENDTLLVLPASVE
jgi:hypothetical protein